MQLFGITSAVLALAASALAAPAPQAGTSTSSSATSSATSVQILPSPVPFVPTNSSSIPPSSAVQAGSVGNTTLIAALKNAGTAADFNRILSRNADHVYDFLNPPSQSAIVQGLGGRTIRSDSGLFPASIGTNLAMTVGFVGPCGFNTPHTHPRSAEATIVIQGTLTSEFVAENGNSLVRNTLNQYQMTIFPQGALHLEFNPTCQPAVFVASFASSDPGVSTAAQRLFQLDDDVIDATLGLNSGDLIDGRNLDAFRSSIPANIALGVESCLTRCGLA